MRRFDIQIVYYTAKQRIAAAIAASYIRLASDRMLTIGRGYAWDEPSGPTFDTKTFLRGSLVHDALYQLIRMGMPEKEWRQCADELLRTICREDGMSSIRAWWVYRAVRIFGASAANPKNAKKILTAP